MPSPSTRQRLTQAAIELFLAQGVTHTTTRQIADIAQVNEATLFRNFGNKYGLLLAMLEEDLTLVTPTEPLYGEPKAAALRSYASSYLLLLEKFPNFVRSLIGEADQYPEEHRHAIRQQLQELQQQMAQQLQLLLLERGPLSADEQACILGALLVGHAVIEATADASFWSSRDEFLDALVATLIPSQSAGDEPLTSEPVATAVMDLPNGWVHQMMKQARSLSLQDYALGQVLFGAGLLPLELIGLERNHQICDKSQHLIQVVRSSYPRQVPVNQWILGKRYGSYTNNPLTKWLKTRKDDEPAMFINEDYEALTLADLQERWQLWWEDIEIGDLSPSLMQARHTWCVEMLMRGISLENLGILTGYSEAELEPYAQRAKEKSAIAAATQLDRKSTALS